MIFVSRVGLLLLIPAAVGLGYAFEALRIRGRPALAVGLGLVCLLEQGTFVSAYDKEADRTAIHALARRIDPGAEAFYYTPDVAGLALVANLEAMWAGVEARKPTINGYSGHTPFGWRDLDIPAGLPPAKLWKLVVALNRLKLVVALNRWKSTYGRSVRSVQWIGGPEDRPGDVVSWIAENNIRVLNVAGNRDRKALGIGGRVERFLAVVFRRLGAAPQSSIDQ
jgi:hypothetical protein